MTSPIPHSPYTKKQREAADILASAALDGNNISAAHALFVLALPVNWLHVGKNGILFDRMLALCDKHSSLTSPFWSHVKTHTPNWTPQSSFSFSNSVDAPESFSLLERALWGSHWSIIREWSDVKEISTDHPVTLTDHRFLGLSLKDKWWNEATRHQASAPALAEQFKLWTSYRQEYRWLDARTPQDVETLRAGLPWKPIHVTQWWNLMAKHSDATSSWRWVTFFTGAPASKKQPSAPPLWTHWTEADWIDAWTQSPPRPGSIPQSMHYRAGSIPEPSRLLAQLFHAIPTSLRSMDWMMKEVTGLARSPGQEDIKNTEREWIKLIRAYVGTLPAKNKGDLLAWADTVLQKTYNVDPILIDGWKDATKNLPWTSSMAAQVPSTVPVSASANYLARQTIHALMAFSSNAQTLTKHLDEVRLWTMHPAKPTKSLASQVNGELAQFYWVALQREEDIPKRSLWCQEMWVAICRSTPEQQQAWLRKFNTIHENAQAKPHNPRLNVLHPWPNWIALQKEVEQMGKIKTAGVQSFWEKVVLHNVASSASPISHTSPPKRQSKM